MERSWSDSAERRRPVNKTFWELLASWGEAEQRDAGDLLIAKSATHTDLMLVESGQLVVNTEAGSEIQLQAPTIVGEQSLLTGRPTNASVSCLSRTHLRRIDTDHFRRQVLIAPEGLALLQALTRLAVDRLRGHFHTSPYLALIAHDGRKSDLIQLAREYADFLGHQALLSTHHTGERLTMELGLRPARKVQSGPLGGDQEVGSLIVAGLVGAVLFFPDPLSNQPHAMDVHALLRLCDVHHIPVATNPSSGHHLLRSLMTETR
jgi:methylglyoxal synthase